MKIKMINLLFLLMFLPVSAGSVNFTYDSLSRLTQTIYSNGTVESFTYDILGNRMSHVVTVPTPQYQVNLSSSGNGTINPTGVMTVPAGSTFSVLASSATGYHFSSWTISGSVTTVENDSSGRFTINGPATIQANFSINAYTITVNQTGSGTVSPSTPTTVNYGLDLSILAIPAAGYHFVNWTSGSGLTIENSAAASTNVKNITASGTVTANFAINQYTVTILASGNGTTTPSGDITANYIGSISVKAMPNSGNHFIHWILTGSLAIDKLDSVAATISNITSNGSATALFARDTLPGSITIDSIDAATGVYMYASNSWIGKNVLTGPGTINNLKPGTYRLCFINASKRRLYKSIALKEAVDTLIHVSLSDAAPMIFSANQPLRDTNNTPIMLNMPVSAVMADVDSDGIDELVVISQSGTVTIYKNKSGYKIEQTAALPLSSGEIVKCVRVADLNFENTPELIVGLNTGTIFTVNLSGSNRQTIYTAANGLTGFDLVDMNNDGYLDILMGFSNGTMMLAKSTGNLTWSAPIAIVTPSDSTISVGVNAVPLGLALNGNSQMDIICGNVNGNVSWFSNNGSLKFNAKGSVNSGGAPLKLNSVQSLSASYPDGVALPFAVMTDDSGHVYETQSILCGDINNDGVVDILDLQQLGIHWGMIDSDSLWDGKVNLNLLPVTGTTQMIDILDLQALGKNWGQK